MRRGRAYRDAEIRLILSTAPTQRNVLLLADALDRTPGAIDLIFRWASTPDWVVAEKKSANRFIQQVKRIAKELGWSP